jgi:hypothetical protein
MILVFHSAFDDALCPAAVRDMYIILHVKCLVLLLPYSTAGIAVSSVGDKLVRDEIVT